MSTGMTDRILQILNIISRIALLEYAKNCKKLTYKTAEITIHTRVIPKVSGLDILDSNIFYSLYISETYILYEL